MNRIIIYVACFLGILFSCSEKKSDELIKINPNNYILQSLSMVDLSNDIQYIPLSNDQVISNIFEIEMLEDKIFIVANNCILSFNIDGSFDRFIGKQGHGPGEYNHSSIFTVDKQGKMVYVYDRPHILQYSFEGDFIRKITFENSIKDFYSILYKNDKLYLFEYLYYGQSKYNWLILDKNGNEIASKLNSIEPFKTRIPGPSKTSYEFGRDIRYWNMYNDTIFTLRDTVYEPYILFDKGGFRYPIQSSDWFEHERYWFPNQIIETEKYIFINSWWKTCDQLFCLDKKNGKMILVDKEPFKASEAPLLTFGIENNLDGGPCLEPFYYVQTDSDEYLVSWFGAFELKAHVASEAFKNSTPKYPEKKRELEQLANSLNDNDNPVLMLVKLKE